jgi:hypothetical protein
VFVTFFGVVFFVGRFASWAVVYSWLLAKVYGSQELHVGTGIDAANRALLDMRNKKAKRSAFFLGQWLIP